MILGFVSIYLAGFVSAYTIYNPSDYQINENLISNEMMRVCADNDDPLDRYLDSVDCSANSCNLVFNKDIIFSMNEGISMCPASKSGDFSVFIKTDELDLSNELILGDVIRFTLDNKNISHRIIDFCDGGVITAGDFNNRKFDNFKTDGCIPYEDINGIQVVVIK